MSMTWAKLVLVLSVLLWTGGPFCGAAASRPQSAAETADTWEFAVGQPDERLIAGAAQMPTIRQPVTLPHRVARPNTALWYAKDLSIPADAALEVDADDGAQVFVDGQRLECYRQWFAVPQGATGRRRVIVRVLNNAMQGGLRRVAFVDGARARTPSSPTISTPRGFEPVESRTFQEKMPGPGQPCAFTVWADSQSGWPTFERLVGLMASRAGAFSTGVGDLVSDGSDTDAWSRFVQTLAPLAARTAIVPVVGNHDYDGSYNDLRAALYERWFRRESPTWFAWSCGPMRLVALDLNREFPIGVSRRSPQWEWLQREVRTAAWKNAGWRIVLVHQPPWSRSWEGYHGDEAVRRIVEPLVRDHGLNVVVSGHSHAYEYLVRSVGTRAVHVLITGGAGGSLEAPQAEMLGAKHDRLAVRHHFLYATANERELTFDAVDLSGDSFDRVAIARMPSATAAPRP
jgi:hypothetical protein